MFKRSEGLWQKTRNTVCSLRGLACLEATLHDIDSRLKAIEEEDSKPLLVSYPPSYWDVLRSIEATVAGIAEEIKEQKARHTLGVYQTLGLGAIAIGFALVTVSELERIPLGDMPLVVIGLVILLLSGALYLLRPVLKKLKGNRNWAAN